MVRQISVEDIDSERRQMVSRTDDVKCSAGVVRKSTELNSMTVGCTRASQIGDKPDRWQVISVTVNSVTSNRWQVSISSVTVIIYQQTTFSDITSRVSLQLAKFIVENNF